MISNQTLSFCLHRLGLALFLLFLINTLFGLLPLQLLTPAWQLRFTDLLLTTAPFTLLGTALVLLGERQRTSPIRPWLTARQIRKLARPAAIGFLLLLPLLLHALWLQIRTADVEAQKTIRSVERRVTAVRMVASRSELQELSRGLPADWQPLAQAPLAENRARLLGRVEPELARLRTNVAERRRQAIQQALKEGSRTVLLALMYAWTFAGVHRCQGLPGWWEEAHPAAAEEWSVAAESQTPQGAGRGQGRA
jgi:hypothetical protein